MDIKITQQLIDFLLFKVGESIDENQAKDINTGKQAVVIGDVSGGSYKYDSGKSKLISIVIESVDNKITLVESDSNSDKDSLLFLKEDVIKKFNNSDLLNTSRVMGVKDLDLYKDIFQDAIRSNLAVAIVIDRTNGCIDSIDIFSQNAINELSGIQKANSMGCHPVWNPKACKQGS